MSFKEYITEKELSRNDKMKLDNLLSSWKSELEKKEKTERSIKRKELINNISDIRLQIWDV
jgi:hypothetical protein